MLPPGWVATNQLRVTGPPVPELPHPAATTARHAKSASPTGRILNGEMPISPPPEVRLAVTYPVRSLANSAGSRGRIDLFGARKSAASQCPPAPPRRGLRRRLVGVGRLPARAQRPRPGGGRTRAPLGRVAGRSARRYAPRVAPLSRATPRVGGLPARYD